MCKGLIKIHDVEEVAHKSLSIICYISIQKTKGHNPAKYMCMMETVTFLRLAQFDTLAHYVR